MGVSQIWVECNRARGRFLCLVNSIGEGNLPILRHKRVSVGDAHPGECIIGVDLERLSI